MDCVNTDCVDAATVADAGTVMVTVAIGICDVVRVPAPVTRDPISFETVVVCVGDNSMADVAILGMGDVDVVVGAGGVIIDVVVDA